MAKRNFIHIVLMNGQSYNYDNAIISSTDLPSNSLAELKSFIDSFRSTIPNNQFFFELIDNRREPNSTQRVSGTSHSMSNSGYTITLSTTFSDKTTSELRDEKIKVLDAELLNNFKKRKEEIDALNLLISTGENLTSERDEKIAQLRTERQTLKQQITNLNNASDNEAIGQVQTGLTAYQSGAVSIIQNLENVPNQNSGGGNG